MERESGCRNFPIWLIGDSPPENWKDRLSTPLDPRHPARHNIWTPVIDGIQDCVFRAERLRVDTDRLYVRNAIQDREHKDTVRGRVWSPLNRDIEELRGLLEQYQPPLVFTFGAFACEFTRRSLGCSEERAYSWWSTKRLGEEFRHSVDEFCPDRINLVPLLHVSISRGRFLESHRYFTCDENGNYFDYVAEKVSALLLRYEDDLDVWVT